MYKPVINRIFFETTETLFDPFLTEPQIYKIISKHRPFGLENAQVYMYPPREEYLQLGFMVNSLL